jgi:Phosphoglycerate dehydrogenase and related dehydrogenases
MKIVFHGDNARNFRDGMEAVLADAHDIVALPEALAGEDEREHFRTADVIVGIRLDASMPRPERLRLYHAPSAGTDLIDRSLLPAGAVLCNCFGHEHAIAEYVMTALLLRHVPIPDADRRLRQGDWSYWAGRPTGLRTELGDSTIGLLGFGHIGKAIAQRAKAFGMRVSVANRSPVPVGALVDEAYGLDDLAAFMGSADVIVVSLPLLPETAGLVGRSALAAMRPDALIVNVGRGPVIDEAALYEALEKRRIGGAIIDTWYRYPSADEPGPAPGHLAFQDLDNIVMTPHMSGWTKGTIRRRMQTIAGNINRLARGEPLVNRA